jgi:hypothetical protein
MASHCISILSADIPETVEMSVASILQPTVNRYINGILPDLRHRAPTGAKL